MKKALLVLLIAVAMIGAVSAVGGNGVGPGAWGKNKGEMRYQEGNHPNNGLHLGQNKECVCEGNGNSQLLVLIGKNSADWSDKVANGFGILTYKGVDDNKIKTFSFRGYGLTPSTGYSLISYEEPWPGTNSIVLGTGNTGADGRVTIAGTGGGLVCNDYGTGTGSKIWLVPTFPFIGWNPNSYLFETELINVGCTP